MPSKVGKIPVPNSTEEIAVMGVEYFQKKEMIKILTDQCSEYRKPLEEYVFKEGTTDPKGNVTAVLTLASTEIILKETNRTSAVMTDDAMEVLKANKLEMCIVHTPSIDTEKITNLYEAGKISDEIMGKLFTSKSGFAFSVSVKGPEYAKKGKK